MRELSRRITFSAAQISNVINGQAQPDADFCIAVAKGLGTDPVDLLRLAGHLPPTAEQARAADPVLDEIIDIYQRLPSHFQTATLHMLRGLSNVPPALTASVRPLSPDRSSNADDAPQIRTAQEEKELDTAKPSDNLAIQAYNRLFDNSSIDEVEKISKYLISLLQETIEKQRIRHDAENEETEHG